MENKNYIKEYYMQEEHNLETIFSTYNEKEEEEMKKIKLEIKNLQKEINEKSLELHNVLDKIYSKNFVPVSKKIGISYTNRNGMSFVYDLETGLIMEDFDTDEYCFYEIGTKREERSVVVGYNYSLGAIILKRYRITISNDNQKITTKYLEEYITSFMENNTISKKVDNEEIIPYAHLPWGIEKSLDKVGNEFINNFYGVNYEGNKELSGLRKCNLRNKSFEIILKTSPKEIVDYLLSMEVKETMPIHKILGISLETYNQAINKGIIENVIKNIDIITNKNNRYNIKKTEKEWLDFIDEINSYEEDLRFYNIDYGTYYYSRDNSLLTTLLYYYTETMIFREHYSLGKWVGYVVNETINQGYNRIRDFIGELSDYLSMCKHDNIKPTLYSSYLKQTHDITSRNHKVIVEKENEETFKSRYEDFKEYKSGLYYVIAPKNSDELKKEGDRLNHCVASYIKRVIDNQCLIYFLRKDKEESLITLEVRHNTIVQVKGLHNRKPNESEIKALKDFAKNRELEVNF